MSDEARARKRAEVIRQAQRAVAEIEDQLFEAAVKADVERVVSELRAGRQAELKDWSPKPDAWRVGDAQ